MPYRVAARAIDALRHSNGTPVVPIYGPSQRTGVVGRLLSIS